MNLPMYEEWESRLVSCTIDGDIHYRIFFGTVSWPNSDGPRTAYVILMQYGHTSDWNTAKKLKEISFQMPAHILEEDLVDVNKALQELQTKRAAGN